MKIQIPQEEWQLAETANDVFEPLRSAMVVLEKDDSGMIAEIWPGLLDLRKSAGEVEDLVVREGWLSALRVFDRWRDRYPRLPTDAQRADLQRCQT
jgi:phenylalanyl-tRNA synthetase beta subunit